MTIHRFQRFCTVISISGPIAVESAILVDNFGGAFVRRLRSNFYTHIFIRRHMASYGVFDPEFEFLVASSLFYPLFLKYNILPTLTVAEHLTWRIVKIRRRALSVSLRRACSAK